MDEESEVVSEENGMEFNDHSKITPHVNTVTNCLTYRVTSVTSFSQRVKMETKKSHRISSSFGCRSGTMV